MKIVKQEKFFLEAKRSEFFRCREELLNETHSLASRSIHGVFNCGSLAVESREIVVHVARLEIGIGLPGPFFLRKTSPVDEEFVISSKERSGGSAVAHDGVFKLKIIKINAKRKRNLFSPCRHRSRRHRR